MKNLSMPQLTEPRNISETSTVQQAQYAAERAKVLFGCYRKGEANDPDRYVAAIIAVLALYPEDTIKYVTDPRTGIPSKIQWMPNVGEVRQACEDHYGPQRRAIEREAAERRQIAERKQLAITDNRPRKTYEELVADCQSRGLMIGPKKPTVETIDAFLQANNITREQFDALPDLPKDIGVARRA